MEIIPWKAGDPPIPTGAVGAFEMAEADYHSDPCEKPSLSSSIAKVLISKSPYHANLMHPKMGGCGVRSDAMDRGSLIHAMILGQPTTRFAKLDVENFTTKAARSMRDSARAEGLVPVKIADYLDAEGVACDVHDDLARQGIELSGVSEIVLLWNEAGVQCRAMQDHLIVDRQTIIDFKTCESAHPEAVQRAIYNFGYDIQHAAYTSAFDHVFPDLAGRCDFIWAFVEELPDGSPRRAAVQLYRPDGLMRELGRKRWDKALRTWAECTASGRWPFYGDGVLQVSPVGWVVKAELGEHDG